ncbi:MAG: Peptidase M23 family protein [Candidatus Tokpelaia sp. JSC189]|nr:MAG: Peptidase M23 family protein [Candidatus Tokpelaia sp. JSC189]
MSLNIFDKASHRYLEGAAFIIIAVILGACSSDFTRFTDGVYTGLTSAQQVDVKGATREDQRMPSPVYYNMHNVIVSGDLPPIPVANSDEPKIQQTAAFPMPTLLQRRSVSALSAFREPDVKKIEKTTKQQIYVVQYADTLSAIARKYDTNVKELKRENRLNGDLIHVAQVLIIPSGTVQLSSVVVEKPVQEIRVSAPVWTKAVETVTVKPEEAHNISLPKNAIASAENIAQEANKTAVIAPQSAILSKMGWPVRGHILNNYGQHEGIATNNGMDIMVPEDTSVKAAENGIVIYAGNGLKEFGKTILIRHEDNIVTVYGHNNRILVQRGQQVHRGDEIAKSGISGNAPTPRLHFEVRKNSIPINPIEYLED